MALIALKITLTIQGPFLTQSSAPDVYGLDAALARNSKGYFYLPGTLLIGKLREAWTELRDLAPDQFSPDIEDWLGKKSDPSQKEEQPEGTVEPQRKRLHLGDLVTNENRTFNPIRYRIRMDSERGAVDKGAYLVTECPFGSGQEIKFEGIARFLACEGEESEQTKTLKYFLEKGLNWISQIGANRTVGFGKVIGVEVKPESIECLTLLKTSSVTDTYDLCIHPEAPFCVGEKRIADNLFESSQVISGGVIKGALASLWTAFQNRPMMDDKGEPKSDKALERHFSAIRITHSFPGQKNKNNHIRAVQQPLSLVKANKHLYDVALCQAGLIEGEAPAFSVDWKDKSFEIDDKKTGDVNELFGWPHLKKELRVRTAIDYKTRRSKKHQLFAYEMIVPNETAWYARLDLSAVPKKERKTVIKQLQALVAKGITGLGKNKTYARMELLPSKTIQCSQESNLNKSKDGYWIITLQTPALLCNPKLLEGTVQDKADALFNAYADTWNRLSKNDHNPDSKGCLELVRFFATQSLAGGLYLWKRFQDTQKNKLPNERLYQPYLLTDAGSVFVLRSTDKSEIAQQKIKEWFEHGLPLPDWAKTEYLSDDKSDWSSCPYLPQNGYGEIAVNLPIHDKKPAANQFTAIDSGDKQ
ncbi:MAG TPA: hypothetical protein EYP59_02665 [Thiotrichaceae bacterium]|nr:hypothetical protein [Thiotrichaceae bacterium]